MKMIRPSRGVLGILALVLVLLIASSLRYTQAVTKAWRIPQQLDTTNQAHQPVPNTSHLQYEHDDDDGGIPQPVIELALSRGKDLVDPQSTPSAVSTSVVQTIETATLATSQSHEIEFTAQHHVPADYRPPLASVVVPPQLDRARPDVGPPRPLKPPKLNDLLFDSSPASATRLTIPVPSDLTKAIVMGRLSSEDVKWVAQELPEWQHAIYTVDLQLNETPPTGFKTAVNKGREAMPYLTYIIDHYEALPDVAVFIHAHRKGYPMAWHNEAKGYDVVQMLRQLRLGHVLQQGYANLRCRKEPGCPDEIRPWREPPDPAKLPEQIYPNVYGTFFNKTYAEYREEIEIVATGCCAQFAVSRAQILKHSKEEYVRWRKFVEATEYSDADIGRVLEYMWHIIFGKSAVFCEDTKKCWCDVYGRCDDKSIRKGGG